MPSHSFRNAGCVNCFNIAFGHLSQMRVIILIVVITLTDGCNQLYLAKIIKSIPKWPLVPFNWSFGFGVCRPKPGRSKFRVQSNTSLKLNGTDAKLFPVSVA